MSFLFQVQITESHNLTHLHVPSLRRHEITLDPKASSTLEGAVIAFNKPPGRATVSYRPDVSELQRRLRSKHALQFVVEYDVGRDQKGGEIQVSGIHK